MGIKKTISKFLRSRGYEIRKIGSEVQAYKDIQNPEFWEVYELCKPFTMTSIDRMYGLYQAICYVLDRGIPGDFVECGVWRGGSALMIAKILEKRGIHDRKVILYDTFEGMPAPTADDKTFRGEAAAVLLENEKDNKEESVWCLADIADVQRNVGLAKLADDQIVLIKGKVEDTIPSQVPFQQVALLRLDTDWYSSTKHELIHLYPMLQSGGVLIIDDYGHWEGCRKAVDEYFSDFPHPILWHRLDYTGRMAIK